MVAKNFSKSSINLKEFIKCDIFFYTELCSGVAKMIFGNLVKNLTFLKEFTQNSKFKG